jgi:hypothetical protein
MEPWTLKDIFELPKWREKSGLMWLRIGTSGKFLELFRDY